MMCFKINESQVEGDSEQSSAHHTEEKNSEVQSEVGHSEEHLEVDLEAQPEQSLSLQDWLNRESHMHLKTNCT